jgi:putative hydrolase of the HAD superfamily
MIKGIIFDFDNTLYDYDTINLYALNFVIQELSCNFNIEVNVIKNKYDKINKQIKNENNPTNKFNKMIYFKKLFEELNISIIHLLEYIQIYNNKFYENFNLYDGVLELFKFLHSKNIKIGILSNNNFSQQYIKIQKTNLINYIDIILTSDECGEEKPSKNIFLLIQDKFKIPFKYLAYVGDSYYHDIIPSLELGMLSFFFNNSYDLKLCDKIIYFNSFNVLLEHLKNYFITVHELVFLSKYFGQSVLNIQGSGGNISIKQQELIFIKASGTILGNMSYDNGYCLADNTKCKNLLLNNKNTIKDIAIFDFNIPSIETFFHSFMKKYTIHLHFTLSNIYFCSNNQITLDNFEYNYRIIDFYNPGIELANEIYKYYNRNCDIYFLKNHGIIITSDNMSEIFVYYDYIFKYFNKICNNLYDNEYISFLINKIYYDNNFSVLVKNINIPYHMLVNIRYIFPDMIVFIKNIANISKLNNLEDKFIYYDIIIYNNNVYCVAENLIKLYSLIEILESYKTIYLSNNGNIIEINDIKSIIEMPQEKYRASLI